MYENYSLSDIAAATGDKNNTGWGGDWRAEGSYRDGYSGARHYVRGHYSHAPYENRSYRDMLENEYSNARDDRERETIRRMLDRM